MLTDVNEEHPENAVYPIEVMLSGIAIEVKKEQPANAEPIEVTLIGITSIPVFFAGQRIAWVKFLS